MPEVSPATKAKMVMYTLLCWSLLPTILIPVSFSSSRWTVVQTDSSVSLETSLGDPMVLVSQTEVELGLGKVCIVSGQSSGQCSVMMTKEIAMDGGCGRGAAELTDRNNAVFAFLIMGFLASLPPTILSLLQLHRNFSLSKRIIVAGIKVNVSGRRTLRIRLLFVCICAICVFVSTCVYGDTFGRWLSCGEHYCKAKSHVEKTKLSHMFLSVKNREEMGFSAEVTCGFGSSFGLMVMALVSSIISALLVFSTLSSKVVPPSVHHVTGCVSTQSPTTDLKNGVTEKVKLTPEGDDWEYDEEAKLFWSPEKQLFFDDASGHYYDPETEEWFNPETEEWYTMM